MKKVLLFALAAISSVHGINAARLTAEQALKNAMATTNTAQRIKATANDFELKWESSNKALYVFSKDSGGFLIASGDDTMPSLLGYSDTSTFDPNSLPPALEAMLLQIDLQMNNEKPMVMARTASSRKDIEPMIKSKWTQNAP